MNQSLPPPNNIKSHILNALIKGRVISERDYSFNSFRARLSDLTSKHNLDIRYNWIKFKNGFGHPGMYREHYLPPEERDKAISEYLKIVGTPIKV